MTNRLQGNSTVGLSDLKKEIISLKVIVVFLISEVRYTTIIKQRGAQ